MFAVGNDIIEIERIKKAIERRGKPFLDLVFTSSEQAYCSNFSFPFPSFAARFAAKEAVAKALGTGIGEKLAFTDIEIVKDETGKPQVHLHGKGKSLLPKGAQLQISLSHCKDYAVATALVAPLLSNPEQN